MLANCCYQNPPTQVLSVKTAVGKSYTKAWTFGSKSITNVECMCTKWHHVTKCEWLYNAKKYMCTHPLHTLYIDDLMFTDIVI